MGLLFETPLNEDLLAGFRLGEKVSCVEGFTAKQSRCEGTTSFAGQRVGVTLVECAGSLELVHLWIRFVQRGPEFLMYKGTFVEDPRLAAETFGEAALAVLTAEGFVPGQSQGRIAFDEAFTVSLRKSQSSAVGDAYGSRTLAVTCSQHSCEVSVVGRAVGMLCVREPKHSAITFE